MRPDPGNVVIEVEDETDSQSRVVARHQAFPNLSGEGQSPAGGLLTLLGLLKGSSACAMDDRHRLELEHAVFDVESLLKVLVSSAGMRICGYRYKISKSYDVIYFANNMMEEDQTGTVDWGSHGTEEREDQEDTVVIYCVGRRFGDRRWSRPGEGPLTRQPERRRNERRTIDRRQCNRLKLIDRYSGD